MYYLGPTSRRMKRPHTIHNTTLSYIVYYVPLHYPMVANNMKLCS